MAGCATAGRPTTASVASADFGRMPDGRPVRLHTLKNASGATVGVSEYGATITSIQVPDRSGQSANVVFGGDSMEAYQRGLPAASVIGRYANRIHGARFTLEGREVRITANEGGNHIHGGREGFAAKLWSSRTSVEGATAIAEFRYRSVDGEEGYPGHLDVTVTYAWNDQNELLITYRAETDRATVVNLTNHAYFNLAGEGEGAIDDHLFRIEADQFLPVGKGLIPTGARAPVAGTAFDFRNERQMGEALLQNDPQFAFAGGIDHNFCLRAGDGLRLAAVVTHPPSGRRLTVSATAPGLQFYSGNFLDGSEGRGGRRHLWRSGFCLEAQGFSNAPNEPDFPNAIVRPGETWRSYAEYALDCA